MKPVLTILGATLAVACGGADPTLDAEGTWTTHYAEDDGVIMSVWGSGPGDIWAVGGQADRSLVLHGDGERWTRVDTGARALLFAAYGFHGSDIYAVGEHGLILHYDGGAWQRVESGTDRSLFGVWGASGDDVWIVGGDPRGTPGSAVVLRGQGGSFHAVDLPADLAPAALFKAHGFAPDDFIVVGSGGTVLRSNGHDWRRESVPTSAPLFSLWGRDANDVYAVGGHQSGEILHYVGGQWSELVDASAGSVISGVFTAPDGPTIAVGPASVLEIFRDGALLEAELPELDPAPFLHGVWGSPDGTFYAVGGDLSAYPGRMSGVILRRR